MNCQSAVVKRYQQPGRGNRVIIVLDGFYDILKHDTLVLTRAAVEKLEARFNG